MPIPLRSWQANLKPTCGQPINKGYARKKKNHPLSGCMIICRLFIKIFVQEGTDITNGIRYHNKDLEAIIESMMQWDLSLYNYRIDGYYQEEDSAMIFNLKSARRFPKRSRTNK